MHTEGSSQTCRGPRRLRIAFVAFVLVAGAAAMTVVYSLRLNFPPIRSDGLGYYLYLPAVFIHQDITLRATAADVFKGRMPRWTGATRYGPNGEYLLHFAMGVAVLELPFFALAYPIAASMGMHRHGFAMPFQYCIASAGLVYAGLGLYLLWGVLAKRFRTSVVLVAMAGVAFGTNLFHYATYDSTVSHAFSFFLFAAFLVAVEGMYERPSSRRFVLVGLVAGLIVLVRPPNALWLVFGVFYGITDRASAIDRLRFVREHGQKLAAAAVVALGVVGLQCAYWLAITGRPVVFPYAHDWFDFGRPQFVNVLFSVRKGLFFWSPILVLCCAGLGCLRRHAPEYLLPVLIYLPTHAYVVASWSDWAYGGSFGHRAFTEAMPAFALGLAALCSARESRRWLVGMASGVVVCIALTQWLMVQYWRGVIPYDGATWRHVLDAFGA